MICFTCYKLMKLEVIIIVIVIIILLTFLLRTVKMFGGNVQKNELDIAREVKSVAASTTKLINSETISITKFVSDPFNIVINVIINPKTWLMLIKNGFRNTIGIIINPSENSQLLLAFKSIKNMKFEANLIKPYIELIAIVYESDIYKPFIGPVAKWYKKLDIKNKISKLKTMFEEHIIEPFVNFYQSIDKDVGDLLALSKYKNVYNTLVDSIVNPKSFDDIKVVFNDVVNRIKEKLMFVMNIIKEALTMFNNEYKTIRFD